MKRKKKQYLAGHQRSWIWGRNAVTEILEAAKWPMIELFLADDLPQEALTAAQQQGRALGADVTATTRERLRELCGATEHQGYLARMGPYPYATWNEVMAEAANAGSPPFYLVLDAIRDPHNFGAIVRSAAALNATAVIIGVEEQSPVNNHVARASAGAVNRIPILQSNSIAEALTYLQERETLCAAADQRGNILCWEYDFNRPVALVMGNESAGVRPELRERCPHRIAIPGSGKTDSLNVAAAGATLLYEAMRQRAG